MNVPILEGEVWSAFPIHGYPKFMVSNIGRVYSEKRKKIMTPQPNKDGYLKIGVGWKETHKNYFMHRLVALAFIENPNNYPIVNHKDGDKQNNISSNLEWCTQSMNVKHAFRIGLESNKGENHPQSKLSDNDVIKLRKMFKEGYTRKQLAEKFNTKPSNIKCIVLRRSWKHI